MTPSQHCLSILLSLCGIVHAGSAAAATLDVPQGHPRLWYSSQPGSPGLARLQRARAYDAKHPLAISGWPPSAQARDRALRSLLHGQGDAANDSDCKQAVAWLKNFTMNVGGVASDEARWDGENAILVYDWCHDAIADSDRSTLLARWNGYVSTLNGKSWGGVTMASNNYFWGYLRNSLLWGIASYHDAGAVQRERAQGYIDHALDTRYAAAPMLAAAGHGRNLQFIADKSRFRDWYRHFGTGGVPLEGTQYGPYMLSYPVIAFTTAGDYGDNAWDRVDFWRDAVYMLQYAAPPGPTRARDDAAPHFEMFPFNDDEFFANGGSAEGDGYADFLAAMAVRRPTSPLARLALTWMQQRGATPSWLLRAELATLAVPAIAPALPLDYYASGARFLYGRRAAQPDATAFMLQLGGANAYNDTDELAADGGVGHSHQDLGNFQLWRKGRWLTRETTGYNISSDGVRGWRNGPVVDPREGVAHNAALFEGRGQIDIRRGWSRVLRLQSTSDFAYAAVDMTESYRAPASQSWLAEDDWPFAEIAIREFVYLRALDALVILDRMTSGSDSLDPVYAVSYRGPRMSGAQVRKSFVLHATGTGGNGRGNPFVLGAAQATATVGEQRMDLRTLLPSNPTYRVIDEGGDVGQFRLEYDVSGSESSTLLNVVSTRDAVDSVLTASISETGDSWRVSLSHPQRGTAVLTLRKGERSVGGNVKIDQQPTRPLLDRVQGMSIDSRRGPFWLSGASGATGPHVRK